MMACLLLFLLREISREIYGKVKDDFLAISCRIFVAMATCQLNGMPNVYANTRRVFCLYFCENKNKIKLQYHSYQFCICTKTQKFPSPLTPRCGRS